MRRSTTASGIKGLTLLSRPIALVPVLLLALTVSLAALSDEPDIKAARALEDTEPAAVPQLPLAFVANEGQWAEDIRFSARRGPMTAHLRRDGIRFLLPGKATSDGTNADALTLALRFDSHEGTGELEGEDRLPSRFNFLVGNDKKLWRSGVAAYASVRYRDLYPGVDLLVHDGERGLQYDLEFRPGADSTRIQVECDGAESLAIDARGRLVMRTRIGELTQTPPLAWQVRSDGARIPIQCAFRLLGDSSYGFVTEGLDPSLPLIIDP